MAEESGQSAKDVEYRIKGTDMAPILLMAGFFDLISLFPLPIAAIFGQFVMTIIWFLHGITPWGRKKWIWYLMTLLLEFIPLVSIVPMFLLGASRMIAITRTEDELAKRGIDAEKMKQMVRIAKGRLMKNEIKDAKEKATWEAGAQKDKQGNVTGFDAERMRQKSDAIQKKEDGLNKALAPTRNIVNRQPEFRQKPKGVDGVQPIDGEA